MQASVRGQVLTAYGAPVPDASVVIADGPGPAPDIAAVTDDQGTFAFDGLTDGAYLFRALGPPGEIGETWVDVCAKRVADARIVLRS